MPEKRKKASEKKATKPAPEPKKKRLKIDKGSIRDLETQKGIMGGGRTMQPSPGDIFMQPSPGGIGQQPSAGLVLGKGPVPS